VVRRCAESAVPVLEQISIPGTAARTPVPSGSDTSSRIACWTISRLRRLTPSLSRTTPEGNRTGTLTPV